MRTFRWIVSVGLVVVSVPLLLLMAGAQAPGSAASLVQRAAALEAAVATLQSQMALANSTISSLQTALAAVQANHALALDPYVSVDTAAINGLAGPHVIFTGANLHVRSGLASTADACTTNPCAIGTLTGLGNLIVGYNEELPGLQAEDRGGSHNLIIGSFHRYLSFGGFVAGRQNTISGIRASVSGGFGNTASGFTATVTGGDGNTASGFHASVSAGESNQASGGRASVGGGGGNTASGEQASVSGGVSNQASGAAASVSGGLSRSAPGLNDWVAGGLFQDF